MSYNIVTINVSQTIGATPSNLQQMSAILSFGGTSQAAGTPILLTRAAELDQLVTNAIGTLEAEENSFGSTFTLTLPDGEAINRSPGAQVQITITGCLPMAWNGTYQATVVDSGTLTYDVAGSSLVSAPSTVGQFTVGDSADLITAVDTFFAQGSSVGTYVLELGYQGDASAPDGMALAQQITALQNYVDDPEKQFYAYLVPAAWAGNENFITMTKLYTANSAKVYFFVLEPTPETTNYITPYAGIKSVIAVADDSYPATNAAAAMMWNLVSASPSPISKVAPMAFRYLQAVSANSAKQSILTTMVSQNINYVDTGAEGGMSNTILVNGVSSDGNDLTYWYSVDWVQINMDMALANEIINGSNNPINPLYFDQDGIDRLQQRAQSIFNTGVSYGLVNGNPAVSAISFRDYNALNPNDYGTGRYAGLSATYTPMRGFVEIIFNINVTLQLS